MFVQLPNTVEGLIHISELADDYYIFLEKQMALVGRRTKRTFRIGQPIKVKLLSVDVEQKEINFKLVNPKEMPTTDLLQKFKDEIPERDRQRNNGRRGGHKGYNNNHKKHKSFKRGGGHHHNNHNGRNYHNNKHSFKISNHRRNNNKHKQRRR